MASGLNVAWPLEGRDAQLLEELGLLIGRAGPAHFLDGPVVRADARDFPEPWEANAACTARLLHRLLWLSYVDLDLAIDDLRVAEEPGGSMLRRTMIEWTRTHEGVAHFQLEQIGNDNVAGQLAHEVGRAFAAWVASADPYREAPPEPPSARAGSIAAVYLGLGVVALNSSQYVLSASEQRGREVITEREVVTAGGLTPRELLLLAAVQAVLRGKLEDAHSTLREDLLEQVRLLVAQLTPHRAALADLLGLDLKAPRPALERDAAAPALPTAAQYPEPDRKQRHADSCATRASRSQVWAGFGWGVLGLFLWIIIAALLVEHLLPGGPVKSTLGWVVVLGVPLSWLVGATIYGALRRVDFCSIGSCGIRIKDPAAATCPGCGAQLLSAVELERLRAENERKAEEYYAQQEAAGAYAPSAETEPLDLPRRRLG